MPTPTLTYTSTGVCRNCTTPGGHPIWFDHEDGVWRHSDSEAVGCGSWAPDGDDGTNAEIST